MEGRCEPHAPAALVQEKKPRFRLNRRWVLCGKVSFPSLIRTPRFQDRNPVTSHYEIMVRGTGYNIMTWLYDLRRCRGFRRLGWESVLMRFCILCHVQLALGAPENRVLGKTFGSKGKELAAQYTYCVQFFTCTSLFIPTAAHQFYTYIFYMILHISAAWECRPEHVGAYTMDIQNCCAAVSINKPT
jgi:hypothetical protein